MGEGTTPPKNPPEVFTILAGIYYNTLIYIEKVVAPRNDKKTPIGLPMVGCFRISLYYCRERGRLVTIRAFVLGPAPSINHNSEVKQSWTVTLLL